MYIWCVINGTINKNWPYFLSKKSENETLAAILTQRRATLAQTRSSKFNELIENELRIIDAHLQKPFHSWITIYPFCSSTWGIKTPLQSNWKIIPSRRFPEVTAKKIFMRKPRASFVLKWFPYNFFSFRKSGLSVFKNDVFFEMPSRKLSQFNQFKHSETKRPRRWLTMSHFDFSIYNYLRS